MAQNATHSDKPPEEYSMSYASGKHFVATLCTLARAPGAPKELIANWRVLEKWLGCANRPLSDNDLDTVGRAWRVYNAIGVAPSIKLQDSFSFYQKNLHNIVDTTGSDRAPSEVMAVFDRMLATDDEIAIKRKLDTTSDVGGTYQRSWFEKSFLRTKLNAFSKVQRLYISCVCAWLLWVTVRTWSYYEIAGIYLEQWDNDYYFANILIPLSVAYCAFRLYKWVMRGV